ncbi:DUF84 family protein [Patescibacteria group bacterium]|nr:DUF84 family protein [Patescibacteria group bacterium]
MTKIDKQEQIRVVVGSENPVKIRAVRAVFGEYFPKCLVVGREVGSGVAEQPRSEGETRRGAENRAQAAVAAPQAAHAGGQASFGVGLEGGVCEIGGKLFECAWAAIVKRRDHNPSEADVAEVGWGGGLYFELPPQIAGRIRAGEELGPIMAELMQYDVKRSDGAIGVLSKGRLTRQAAYEQIVKMAILKFVSPEWWE